MEIGLGRPPLALCAHGPPPRAHRRRRSQPVGAAWLGVGLGLRLGLWLGLGLRLGLWLGLGLAVGAASAAAVATDHGRESAAL